MFCSKKVLYEFIVSKTILCMYDIIRPPDIVVVRIKHFRTKVKKFLRKYDKNMGNTYFVHEIPLSRDEKYKKIRS